MASSKSRAVAGSIVTREEIAEVERGRRSRLRRNSLACSRASSRTSSSKVSGMLNARMTVSVSTPGCPRWPRISVMTPSPSRYGLGYRTISSGHLVAGPGPLGAGSPTVDRVVKRRAVDPDEAGAACLEIRPDEDPRGPRQDLDDPPFDVHPRPPRPLGDLDRDLVAAGGIAAGLGRDVDLIGLHGRRDAAGRTRIPWPTAGTARRSSPPDRAGEGLVLGQVELPLLDEPLTAARNSA